MYLPADPARIVSYATANGKAWLATMPEKDAARIAQREGIEARNPSPDVGPKALRSLAALKRDLALTRTRGYAVSVEEGERGVTAVAVAIVDPESGKVLGTTSVAGPLSRLTEDHHERIAGELFEAARQLAKIWPLKKPAAQKSVAG